MSRSIREVVTIGGSNSCVKDFIFEGKIPRKLQGHLKALLTKFSTNKIPLTNSEFGILEIGDKTVTLSRGKEKYELRYKVSLGGNAVNSTLAIQKTLERLGMEGQYNAFPVSPEFRDQVITRSIVETLQQRLEKIKNQDHLTPTQHALKKSLEEDPSLGKKIIALVEGSPSKELSKRQKKLERVLKKTIREMSEIKNIIQQVNASYLHLLPDPTLVSCSYIFRGAENTILRAKSPEKFEHPHLPETTQTVLLSAMSETELASAVKNLPQSLDTVIYAPNSGTVKEGGHLDAIAEVDATNKILCCNEHEIITLYNHGQESQLEGDFSSLTQENKQKILLYLKTKHFTEVIVTLGDKGVDHYNLSSSEPKLIHVDNFDTQEVVNLHKKVTGMKMKVERNTTGCGDTVAGTITAVLSLTLEELNAGVQKAIAKHTKKNPARLKKLGDRTEWSVLTEEEQVRFALELSQRFAAVVYANVGSNIGDTHPALLDALTADAYQATVKVRNPITPQPSS